MPRRNRNRKEKAKVSVAPAAPEVKESPEYIELLERIGAIELERDNLKDLSQSQAIEMEEMIDDHKFDLEEADSFLKESQAQAVLAKANVNYMKVKFLLVQDIIETGELEGPKLIKIIELIRGNDDFVKCFQEKISELGGVRAAIESTSGLLETPGIEVENIHLSLPSQEDHVLLIGDDEKSDGE